MGQVRHGSATTTHAVTNAAICGVLLGAAFGRDCTPQAWRRQVLACRAVVGKGVAHPRPSEFWSDDALDVAEALLAVSFQPEGSQAG